MTFVIRSMSTTDASAGEQIRPYHVYLLPREKRARAWWTASLHLAWKFDSHADALDEVERCGSTLYDAQIVPADADARGLPPYWSRHAERPEAV